MLVARGGEVWRWCWSTRAGSDLGVLVRLVCLRVARGGGLCFGPHANQRWRSCAALRVTGKVYAQARCCAERTTVKNLIFFGNDKRKNKGNSNGESNGRLALEIAKRRKEGRGS